MNSNSSFSLSLLAGAILVSSVLQAETNAAAKVEHGEYRDWRLLSVSLRHDKQQIRAIVGNHVAIQAARGGHTKPWPDGTVLTKIKWAEKRHPNWEQATVPGEFNAAESMVKDSKKYAETGGWGFGIWEGKTLKMLDKEKSAPCFACHLPMKDHDYVYTAPQLQ